MDIQEKLQMFYWLKFGLWLPFNPKAGQYIVADITGRARVFITVSSDKITYEPELKRPDSEQLLTELKAYLENETPPVMVRKPGGPRPE